MLENLNTDCTLPSEVQNVNCHFKLKCYKVQSTHALYGFKLFFFTLFHDRPSQGFGDFDFDEFDSPMLDDRERTPSPSSGELMPPPASSSAQIDEEDAFDNKADQADNSSSAKLSFLRSCLDLAGTLAFVANGVARRFAIFRSLLYSLTNLYF